jgi:hypothetical protein
MDPYTHTLIAVGLMFGSYWAGRHLGYKDGLIDVWSALLTVFDAKSIVINEDEELIVTDKNGAERKVN